MDASLRLYELPRQMPLPMYEEAVVRYASAVRPRAFAVYRSGEPRYGGLCGVSVIVVVQHAALDNRYFFSALGRLPRRFLDAFVHEPFIVPSTTLSVMRHTNHANLQIVTGRDELRRYAPAGDEAEAWCRMLEAYCSGSLYIERVRESGALHGRKIIAALHALRETLDAAAALLAVPDRSAFGLQCDRLLETFFSQATIRENVLAAWELFTQGFAAFDEAVKRAFGTVTRAQTFAAARDALRGEYETTQFDREYAFRRALAIDGYHADLAALGFPFGHLFYIAGHPRAVRTSEHVPVLAEVLHSVYRAYRRIEDLSPHRR
jgi:hypothetical protein